MGKIGNFIKTITIGGIIGFVGGLLFAPTKGEEAREKLQDALAKGKEKFKEIKDEFSKKEE
ncbi:MAG: YtxH domain-containing protein [Candidatus Margulisbacteria bacterium]|nr:YtxH domain-containing protein [Candidatus Margulisiibacteriota bacterium]